MLNRSAVNQNGHAFEYVPNVHQRFIRSAITGNLIEYVQWYPDGELRRGIDLAGVS